MIFCFHFNFCLEVTLSEQLNENDFRHYHGIFFRKCHSGTIWSAMFSYVPAMFKVHKQVFLGKGFLKICSKFTGEHPCRSGISIKLLCNFIEITLRHGCSLVNFQTTFSYEHALTAASESSFATITRHFDNGIWKTHYSWKLYGHGSS